mmetsp:Transcript_72174/g.139472  ORF Transcript_72174/g.139472 Transcript_72174/m.139472 type:complete len:213 (+) Transcript_72174:1231-1869(+)
MYLKTRNSMSAKAILSGGLEKLATDFPKRAMSPPSTVATAVASPKTPSMLASGASSCLHPMGPGQTHGSLVHSPSRGGAASPERFYVEDPSASMPRLRLPTFGSAQAQDNLSHNHHQGALVTQEAVYKDCQKARTPPHRQPPSLVNPQLSCQTSGASSARALNLSGLASDGMRHTPRLAAFRSSRANSPTAIGAQRQPRSRQFVNASIATPK